MTIDFFKNLDRQDYDPATYALATILRDPSDAELSNVMHIIGSALGDQLVWPEAKALRHDLPRVRDAFLLRHPGWNRTKIMAAFAAIGDQLTCLSSSDPERETEVDPDGAAFWLIERLTQAELARELEMLCTAARFGEVTWPKMIERGAELLAEIDGSSAHDDRFSIPQEQRPAFRQ